MVRQVLCPQTSSERIGHRGRRQNAPSLVKLRQQNQVNTSSPDFTSATGFDSVDSDRPTNGIRGT